MKIYDQIDDAFERCDIQSGQVLSFHHHYRNGDRALIDVLKVAKKRGLKGLGIAISSIFPVHAPLVDYMKDGTVTRLWTGYINGPVGDAILDGVLEEPVIIHSHGGRAYALQTGVIKVDVAFIAAPMIDRLGNVSGCYGEQACGPLGYAMVDAEFAKKSVCLFAETFPSPFPKYEIPSEQIDLYIKLDDVGDPSGISSGTTKIDPTVLQSDIVNNIIKVITESGLLKDGFSFQTGAGKYSLACVQRIGQLMKENNIKGSFISGGITKAHVDLLEAGLFERIYDVQCFDPAAIRSCRENENHIAMSAAQYASPLNSDNIADQLDVAILGASEIDVNFNVNVTTTTDGRIIGGPGGHPDVAEGSKLSIIATPAKAGQFSKIVDQVFVKTTIDSHIDVVICDDTVLLNPKNQSLDPLTLEKHVKLCNATKHLPQTRNIPYKLEHLLYSRRIAVVIKDRYNQAIDYIYTRIN